jgi:gluconokinase
MPSHQETQKETAPRRWVVMGVSGSGKSAIGTALAAALAVPFIEGDAFHPAANVAKMSAGMPLDDHDRSAWLLLLQAKIGAAREDGTGLVVSCSALKRRYRDLLRAADPALYFVHLDGAPELIATRLRNRAGHFMPPALLESQLRDLEPLQADEAGLRLDVAATPAQLLEQILVVA